MTQPFIVAEMSANHLGSLDRALRIVDAAARAGADAIKVQTWLPGTMCVSDYAMTSGPWAGRKLRDLYEEAHLPWKWHEPIFKAARALGLEPFSAAFDCESVDFLESLDVKRHKVASFEITDLPLIRCMASKGKPMILSLGAARYLDAGVAEAHALSCGAPEIIRLRCCSKYPAPPDEFDLTQFEPDEGISDHSLGIEVAVKAAALGACYIEKHLTLSRSDGGPDAGFSMEPDEFAALVREVRRPRDVSLCRSLWVVAPIQRGESLVLGQNVRTARPALGLPCDTLLDGRAAARALHAGEPLTTECIA